MSAQDLDDLSKAILEAIYHNGGTADTSEIKQYTGFDDNGKLHYRRNKHLEPNGFTKSKDEDKGDPMKTTVWILTEKGEKAVDRNMTEQDTPPIADQFEELREIVTEINNRMAAIEGRMDDVEDRVNGTYERADEAERMAETAQEAIDRIEGFEERLDEIEDQPIEDMINSKIQVLEEIYENIQYEDAMNRDVRSILCQHGILSRTTRKVARVRDFPDYRGMDEEQWEDLKDRLGHKPMRDGYVAGPALEN
jgi:DNA-binding PadR family transcriptional regulator